MALQVTFNDNEKGLSLTGAYAKVENFRGDKDEVSFQVAVYVNEQARLDGKVGISSHVFTVPYVDGMSIQTLYDYLKTLPEFAGAIDV